MKRVFFLTLLSSVLAAGAAPADFYVATNGNDAAAGTLAAPFATLDRARAAVQALKQRARATPIVVMVRGGTYFLKSTLRFTADDSGSAQAPVVYQAYPGETPVISGGRQVTGWKLDAKTGYWVASLPSDFQYFEQLFVNGKRRFRPRTTKDGYLYNEGSVFVDTKSPTCPTESPGQGFRCYDRFKFKPGDLRSEYANITDVRGLRISRRRLPAPARLSRVKDRVRPVRCQPGGPHVSGAAPAPRPEGLPAAADGPAEGLRPARQPVGTGLGIGD